MTDPIQNALRIATVHTGPLVSHVAGRTDHHPIDVPPESFVIPADVVSGLGEGNTLNGMEVLRRIFNMPSGPQRQLARGGIPIAAAGGEFIVPPDVVKRLGDGDAKKGHEVLRRFVLRQRKKHIKTLKSLPSPVR